MSQVLDREIKDRLYDQFSRVGKAMGSPKRVEILDLLCQAESTVESLASATGMGVTNTSAHLQALRSARLVEPRKEGTKVFYRVADDSVCEFFFGLRALARERLAEVEQIARDFFEARDRLEPVTRTELLERLQRSEVVVVDVRPRAEYRAGHIPGAISLPIDELTDHVHQLPKDGEIVAYCRGPYCVFAPQALEILRENGFQARRLEEGFPEWRLAGLPVATGAE